MKSIVAMAFAAAFMCSPALAQDKGKSTTAPGQADTSPGKKKDAQGSAKAFAPGQQQDQPRSGCRAKKEVALRPTTLGATTKSPRAPPTKPGGARSTREGLSAHLGV
jgi:hypothetical protein